MATFLGALDFDLVEHDLECLGWLVELGLLVVAVEATLQAWHAVPTVQGHLTVAAVDRIVGDAEALATAELLGYLVIWTARLLYQVSHSWLHLEVARLTRHRPLQLLVELIDV